MNTVLFSEHQGTFSKVKVYREKEGGQVSVEEAPDNAKDFSSQSKWSIPFLLTFRQIFLPSGFPTSVSKDYLEYQFYDSIQAFCSSITGALATESVMRGHGVGTSEASPAAAAMTTLIQRGSGMLGQIIFTWFQGPALDFQSKKFRLFADVVNDFAIFLDLLVSWFPSSFTLFLFVCSSIARSLVGVAGGATRAAITQHQAKNNNASDVSAKDGSQETIVNLISLMVSLILLPVVSGHHLIIWALFLSFTFLHIFANYKALRSLELETFNTSRLLYALDLFINHKRVPSVREANKNESLIIGFGIKDSDVCGFRVRMGISLESALNSLQSISIQQFFEESKGRPFLILRNEQKKIINVILSENIDPINILEAYTRTILYAAASTKNSDLSPYSNSITEIWEEFCKSVTLNGYNLNSVLIETGEWRGKWKHE